MRICVVFALECVRVERVKVMCNIGGDHQICCNVLPSLTQIKQIATHLRERIFGDVTECV